MNNSSAALWTNITVTAIGQGAISGNVFVPQTPEQFSYDADGNLTNDGRWAYTWDAENRLATMTVNTNVGPQYQLTFTYDSKGRRIQKIVSTNSVALYTNKFIYDGWNLIAETKPNNSLIRSYVWGTDLSGSAQDAGGVGGLLKVSYYGSVTTNCFPAYDGNGNVAALVSAADGTVAANYEYGPFGEVIRATGPMTKANPFRFSTKYQDDESDLLYYGYRYYKPSTGSWLGRDPMGERGGMNLYGFVQNNPLTQFDPLGLSCQCGCDVTMPLTRTLGNIDAIFWLWDRATAYKACKRIINPFGGQASHAWDIEELHIGKGPEDCDRTITFNKGCYYKSAANYSMFGRACALCSQRFGVVADP